MALINTGPDYTRTGDNFLTRWANAASFIPIPGVNTTLTWFLGMAGAAWDAIGWLGQGKVLSAATAAASGAVGATVNSIGGTFWWLNAGSGLATGRSAGTHARALTETVIGGVTGALGVKPTVLRSYTAGIGQGPGASVASTPGYYASMHGGANPQEKWDRYRSGAGAQHLADLEAARATGPSQRAI